MAQYANERARLRLLPPPSEAIVSDAAAVSSDSAPAGEHSPASQASALSDGSVGSGAHVDGISRRSSSTDATAVELDLEEGEQEGGKLSVLLDFGPASRASKRSRTGDIGNASFVYDPELVRTAVFPPPVAIPAATPPTRKKRKLDTGVSSPVEAAEPTPKMRTVILYNDTTT